MSCILFYACCWTLYIECLPAITLPVKIVITPRQPDRSPLQCELLPDCTSPVRQPASGQPGPVQEALLLPSCDSLSLVNVASSVHLCFLESNLEAGCVPVSHRRSLPPRWPGSVCLSFTIMPTLSPFMDTKRRTFGSADIYQSILGKRL